MGFALALPGRPCRVPAGLKGFPHLNHREQMPQPAHNRLGPPWRAVPIATRADHRRGRSPVAHL
jgi:hypothetical protein